MIRLLIFLIFAIIIILFSIPALIIGTIWGKFDKPGRSKATRSFVIWVFKTVNLIAGVKTTAIGLENIPDKDTAVLFIGNHRSFFDIIISYTYFKGNTGFVAKKELEKIPLLKTWMNYIGCLFLDRTNAKEGLKTILEAIDTVKSGTSVFIFPEGTRATTDSLLDFKDGSFKIATKSKCLIVPVVQNNTNAVLEDHFPFLKSTHTVIEFCKPVDPETLSPEDKKNIGTYFQKIVQDVYNKNQALVK